MNRRLRQAGLCVLLSACALPAHALDPILMFLLSAAREVIIAAEKQKSDAPAAPAPVPVPADRYPGTTVRPDQLRRLIDESFTYLSEGQRREIFDSLHASLMDPKNIAVRGAMIDYFVAQAVAVREAQERLASLSEPDRERLLTEFRSAVAAIPDEDAKQLADLLRRGVLPVPGELNAQLLAALDAR